MIRHCFFIALGINTTVGGIGVMVIGLFQRHFQNCAEWIMKPWAKSLVWIVREADGGRRGKWISAPYIVLEQSPKPWIFLCCWRRCPIISPLSPKELFRILFCPGNARIRYSEIDRSNCNRAIATLKTTRKLPNPKNLHFGISGRHRSEDGQLKPFKKRPFMLALDARLPVLPVSISGTFPILPKGKLLIRGGQQVRVTIHPPVIVENASYESREQLMDETYQRVASGFMQYES